MRIAIETITPQQAQQLLETNILNRYLRPSRVEMYANDMAAGRWHVTGEPITIDTTGRLLNGQHRLAACVRSGVPFTTAVARCADSAIFDVIDSGLKRSMNDISRQIGFRHASLVASTAKVVLGYRKGALPQPRDMSLIPRSEITDEMETNRHLYTKWANPTEVLRKRGHNGSGALAFMVLAEAAHGAEPVTSFVDGLISGADLAEGDPRLVLQRLINGANRPRGAAAYLSVIIRAYTPWLAGEPRSKIQSWFPPAPFPQLPQVNAQRHED